MAAGKVFKETFNKFSEQRLEAWKDFGHYAPTIFRPGEFMGYVGGRTAADYVSDATRNDIWRLNALQAQTTDLGRWLGKKVGLNKRDSMLAGVALTNVVELSSGNIDLRNLGEAGRPKGYRSIFPEESEGIDPKTGELVVEKNFLKSQNPIAEMGARYFLGRTGSVLPWDQFKLERPDVTPEEYARYMKKHRDRTLFGLENASRAKTGIAGAAIGGAVAALTKKASPVLLGAAGGVMAPGTANIVSELGIVQGTRESFDDPVGELRVFGYRMPIARVAGAVALAAGLGVGGKKLMDSGLLKRPGPLEKAYDATAPAGKLWDDAINITKVDPPTEAELREIARRLGKDYPKTKTGPDLSPWDKYPKTKHPKGAQ
jgi:hypothetical protein